MSLLASSAFDPTGQYYASVIQALDTHKVRVQSTESSSLAQAFALDKGLRLTTLSWGVTASTSGSKKATDLSIENQAVNAGVNKGSILVYNPLANQVIGTLENPNGVSIVDYQFSELTNSGWSVDINHNVIEWDLILFKPKQQLKFNDSITVVRVIEYQGRPHLLLASHSIQLYDITNKEVVKTFPGHISPIHTVIPFSSNNSTNPSHIITAASGDRFINIYSLADSNTHVLVAQSNVVSISHNELNLTTVTEDGIVEVFMDILTKPAAATSRRKGQQSKQSQHKVTLQRKETSQALKIDQSFLNQDTLKLTWLENADIPYFHSLSLSSLTTEEVTISKEKPALQAKDHSLYGTDVAAPARYREGDAHVTSGDNLRHLNNAFDQELEYDENDGPSLSEKLDLLKVEATLPKKKAGRATTGSLAVVLTQALRSNDHTLLETVLANRDQNVIKSTIERLDTTLAVLLLERLAERIARQTNRQGQLNTWVRWVLVIHGSYLVNVPNLAGNLSSLHSTLVKRSNTLGRLNELKGKLEVFYAARELNGDFIDDEFDSEDEDEESDVEYIEELEDAGLIVDGEEDFEMEQDQEFEEEDGFIKTTADSDDDMSVDEKLEKFESDGEYDQEEGFSDEEIGINGAEIEEESEDDQQQLMKKIKALKAKQDKKKNGRK